MPGIEPLHFYRAGRSAGRRRMRIISGLNGIRTRYRQALQVALAAHFASVELPIEFQAGELTGRQQLDVGCVWFRN